MGICVSANKRKKEIVVNRKNKNENENSINESNDNNKENRENNENDLINKSEDKDKEKEKEKKSDNKSDGGGIISADSDKNSDEEKEDTNPKNKKEKEKNNNIINKDIIVNYRYNSKTEFQEVFKSNDNISSLFDVLLEKKSKYAEYDLTTNEYLSLSSKLNEKIGNIFPNIDSIEKINS